MSRKLTFCGWLLATLWLTGCGAETASSGEVDATATSDGGGSEDGAGTRATLTPCASDADCDDKLSCTTDTCEASGLCQWTLVESRCLIGSVCYEDGALHPGVPCQRCDAASATTSWSTSKAGSECDDGSKCSLTGSCDADGTCVADPLNCDDNNPCTADTCVAGQGCVYPPVGVTACDDDDACTEDEACTDGQCVGAAVSCDDDEPCTTDACEPSQGCTHTDNTEACDDGDACTSEDACAEGACVSGGSTNCDDGNACTIDSCDKQFGCNHLPTQNACCTGQTSICDDGNPCTTDLCDPKTSACSQELNKAICDDGDACTQKDTCGGGKCTGQVKPCDDKNVCTLDACDKAKGCVYGPSNEGQSCDDGDPCSKDEKCTQGKCVGTGGCACTPKFSDVAAKVTDLKIGKGGQPGEGLDLDNDAKTCAPSSSCTGGIDNALGALAGLVNTQLDSPVASGSILLLVEFMEFKQGPVKLAIHQGELDASNKTCDLQKQTCKYTADTSLIDPKTCAPKAALSGTLAGTKLTAGGKGTNFPFSLPLQDGVYLNLTLYDLQLVGTVQSAGGKVESMTAILGGAVLKQDLEKAIDALPAEGLPIPKATIKSLLNSTVEVDIDVNGDSKPEASSIALKISAIPAIITGAK